MANEFKIKKGLIVNGSGGTILDVQGSVGQLFSVTDSLTGDLFAVSDISGVPILNVNSSGVVDVDGSLDVTGNVTGLNLNVSNWNTAYGWGNHASAGYSTATGVANNANNYSLPAGTASTRGGFKIGYSESGKNYPVEVSSEKMYVNVPWTDNNTDTITSVGVTGSETTGTITLTAAGGITLTQSGQTVEIRSADSDTTYTVGDGGLTQKNFTTTLKNKLDGIAASATNVTNNSQLTNGAGYITGVSFANVSSKPEFSANSMLSNRSTTAIDTVGDSNGVTFNYLSSSTTDKPGGNDASLMTMSYSTVWQTQLAQDWRNKGRLYLRGQNAGTWSSWIRVHSTDDFSTTDVANGVTAHGWGNHASAGYLTAHPSITEAADVNNSNGTVIQDLTFDDNGHVTATGSVNLDGRYYTETEIDNELNTLSASLRANTNITGGGTITFNSGGYIKNSVRFIVIANGRGSHFATSGYFDVNIPTSGTITGVGGASDKTATSDGIPIDTWEALYYILPVGSSYSSVAANFRVARYTANVVIPETWILLAVRNGDTGQKVWVINKYGLELGQSIDTTVYDARYAQYAASAGSVANFSGTSSGTNTGDQDLSGYSTASGVEDNADVTDTANVVAALTAGTNVQIAADGTISATDTDTVYTHPTSAGNKHIPTGGAAGEFLKYSASGTAVWATPSYTTNTDTVYTHPTTAGNKHIPTGGAAGEFLKYSSSGTAVWATPSYTTYSNATTSASGLMSSTDKTKLNGIANNADNYTGWNFVDTSDTATRIDSVEYFKIAGSTISGTGTSADPYLVNTPDTDTNTWRPIDTTPTNGATGESISSDWAYDNVRLFSSGGQNIAGSFTATGDITAYSDARVKENVKAIPNALESVKQMKGVTYNKIGDKKQSVGVIAQELQEVMPQLVNENPDGMLSVAYGNITAVLIEAIKEQQKQIDELKARLS